MALTGALVGECGALVKMSPALFERYPVLIAKQTISIAPSCDPCFMAYPVGFVTAFLNSSRHALRDSISARNSFSSGMTTGVSDDWLCS